MLDAVELGTPPPHLYHQVNSWPNVILHQDCQLPWHRSCRKSFGQQQIIPVVCLVFRRYVRPSWLPFFNFNNEIVVGGTCNGIEGLIAKDPAHPTPKRTLSFLTRVRLNSSETVQKIKKDGMQSAVSNLKTPETVGAASKKIARGKQEAQSFGGHLLKEFQKELGIKK